MANYNAPSIKFPRGGGGCTKVRGEKRSDSQLKQKKQTNKTTKTKTTKTNNNSWQNKHLQKPICQTMLLQKQFKGTFFHLN